MATITGTTGNDDLDGDLPGQTINGLAGDDTLTAGGAASLLYGNDGDDVLRDGAYNNVTLVGGPGSDTYVIDRPGTSTGVQLYTYIRSAGDADNPGRDAIDLSAVVDDKSQLFFEKDGDDLRIFIYDANRLELGRIQLVDYFSADAASEVADLVLGSETFDISSYASAAEINSVILYGASAGGDVILGVAANETLTGLGGDDRLVAGGKYSVLHGGPGNDTLESGNSTYTSFYGNAGDDIYVADWTSASSSVINNLYINYFYDRPDTGLDTLDLSSVVDSVDQLRFIGSSTTLQIYTYIGTTGNGLTGVIFLGNHFGAGDLQSVETLVIDGQSYDLTGAVTGNDLDSMVRFGASYGDDDITITRAAGSVYGLSGDDTLRVGDVEGLWVDGGTGDDTYVVSWGAGTSPDYSLAIAETSSNPATGGIDTIDLSPVVDSIAQVSFFAGGNGNLYLSVHDAGGDEIGVVWIDGQTRSSGNYRVENLVIGDQTYDLTRSPYVPELASILKYGVGPGGDHVVATLAGEAIIGLAGNDTLETGGHDDVEFIDGVGDDTYVVAWSGASAAAPFDTTISYRTDYEDAGSDTLDLSAVASSLDDIRLVSGANGSLVIYVYDDSDKLIGRVTLEDQFQARVDNRIETLVIDGESFTLGAYDFFTPLSDLFDQRIGDYSQTLVGTGGDDTLYGYGGDDVLSGGAGLDRLVGGSGNDSLDGGIGADVLIGGDGNDTLAGSGGDDVIRGDTGDDVSYGGNGNDAIWAGAADAGADLSYGEGGNDVLGGGAGADTLVGGAGADTLFGGDDNDALFGGFEIGDAGTGDSRDVIWGGQGDDTVDGGDGNDLLGGGAGDDVVTGGAGNDRIYGGSGAGDDTISGGEGDDVLYAGLGDDVVSGGDGDDNLFSGGGSDTVDGGAGDDTLWGGDWNDVFTGGAGSDLFIFAAGHCNDTVTDFDISEDRLDLSGALAGFSSAADVAGAAAEVGGGILIDLGGGDSLLLQGLSIADIAAITLVL